ncbi:MAG: DUF1365 domain-containing protein [Thioalkalivibrionaceae bacterium]
MHARRRPHPYRFTYRVFTVLWDVDQLEAGTSKLRGFGFDRIAPVMLRRRDHGPRDGGPWRPWLERTLNEHELPGSQLGRVRLLAMPRVLGFGFNPLSLWYCDSVDGKPLACILEVRNTFGEHHHYVLDARAGYPLRTRRPKAFHVSPFIDMSPYYDFRIEAPPDQPHDRLGIFIRESDKDGHLLSATQTARACVLDGRQLLAALVRAPWTPIQVLTLIHWQALKIWLRGTPFHRHPNTRSRGSA